jgi:hypothetical protein
MLTPPMTIVAETTMVTATRAGFESLRGLGGFGILKGPTRPEGPREFDLRPGLRAV